MFKFAYDILLCKRSEIEQFVEESAAFLLPGTLVISTTILRRRWDLDASFDDLVQFSAIKPDAAALRAIVDFHSVPIGHHKCCSVDGTLHFYTSSSCTDASDGECPVAIK
jgi:hypothetical protein